MSLDPKTLTTGISATATAVGKIAPCIKRLNKERKAGQNPYSVPDDLTDSILDDTLKRLGVISEQDPLWKKLLTASEGAFTRPEMFQKPAVTEWLSISEVSSTLKSLAKARTFNSPIDEDEYKFLLDEFSRVTFDGIQVARSVVETAIAVLKVSLEQSPADSGGAAFFQTATRGIQNRFDGLDKKIDKIASANILNNTFVSEHHGHDVNQRLESIKLRRMYHETDTLGELTELAKDIEQGGYVGTPPNIAADVYFWLARVAAAHKNIDLAQSAKNRLLEISRSFDTAIIDAWLDVANGIPDAGLRRLRERTDADSRTVMFSILLHEKEDSTALEFLKTLDLDDRTVFTPIGWRVVIACLLRANRLEDAVRVLANMSNEDFRNNPLLLYLNGVVNASYLVAEPYRELISRESFSELREHLLSGKDIDEKRTQCIESFELAKSLVSSSELKKISAMIERWLIFLRLADPKTRDTEISRIAELMKDGSEAVDLIQFAFDFGINFEQEPLESHLMRQHRLGGLTPKEQIAMMFLYMATNEFNKLSIFITEHWELLVENIEETFLATRLIQSLCSEGKCEHAEEVFEKYKQKFVESNIPRLELAISECKGEDTASKAISIYKKSQDLMDLTNAVRCLSVKRRWHELTPYALELFQIEPTADNANRYLRCLREANAKSEDTLAFLAKCTHLLETDDDLKSSKAWALFHLGKINDARILNNTLLTTRHHINDISLDLYIALRSGDWDKFPAIIQREWENRKNLPVSLQFNLAKLATGLLPDLALQLAQELVEQHPTNPNILLQAFSILITLSRDDLAMPLIHRAADLSKADGPVKRFATNEAMEILRSQTESFQDKNVLFREGKIPLHFAAIMFNMPLSRLLIAIPHQNEAENDARKRVPIPIRSGVRRPIDLTGARRIILDITTVMLLNEIDCLDIAITLFDKVYVSPRVMEFLHFEMEKVQFHQPSRVKEVRPLLDLLHAKRIFSLNSDLKNLRGLIDEVGCEMAVLLDAAKSSKSVCVHTGPLYKASSLLEQLADIGDYHEYLTNPGVVAETLYEEGYLSQEQFEKAYDYLNCVSGGVATKQVSEEPESSVENSVSKAVLPPAAPIYLDTLSAQYLSHTDLISTIRKSGRTIVVHQSSVEEWEALANTEPYAETITESLDKIRKSLLAGMKNSKVLFLKEGHWDEENESQFGLLEMPLVDILADVSCADVVCIDDRCFNLNRQFACIYDLLDLMEQKSVLSGKKRRAITHKMRVWGFFTLPIGDNELIELLADRVLDENGILRESAELRAIRENLANVHAVDVLTTPEDLDYLDHLWHTGLEAIRKLWSDEASDIALTQAKANWIVDYVMPDIELALRHAPDRQEHLERLSSTRLMVMLLPPQINDERRTSWREWVENKIISEYLPSNPQVVDRAAKQIAELIAQNISEGVNELRKIRGFISS
ncbi:hypothetical protein [Trichlorobacter lovleyi]|uniref:HTH domain-containing protein n=1 Tax=Trichlorobacter lovleyi TaxID=313985 RepID=UPI0024802714|nr:hypothetical protein [Trichlorobacter lovleyi]